MPSRKDEQAPSRSARKRAAQAVEDLARRLTGLPETELRRLPLPPDLLEEIRQARAVPTHSARDRQVRHLAWLLRRREDELTEVELYLAGQTQRAGEEQVRFHRLEQWRDRLCDPGSFAAALQEVARQLPEADAEGLSRLSRAAQGGDRRAFREIFRVLRRADET